MCGFRMTGGESVCSKCLELGLKVFSQKVVSLWVSFPQTVVEADIGYF